MNIEYTAKTISNRQIRSLRAEAVVAEDFLQVAICSLAEHGEFNADDWTTLSAADVTKVSDMTQEQAQAACAEAVNRVSHRHC